MQDAHAPKSKTVDVFAYHLKVQNTSAQAVEIIFWEYQFNHAAEPTGNVRRQFLCAVNLKPRKEKDMEAFSLLGASDVINASVADPAEKPLEAVIINRVEYADGTIWQRKEWNYAAMRASIARVVATPWGAEMCRSL